MRERTSGAFSMLPAGIDPLKGIEVFVTSLAWTRSLATTARASQPASHGVPCMGPVYGSET